MNSKEKSKKDKPLQGYLVQYYNTRTWYAYFIGLFPTREFAKAYAKEFVKNGGTYKAFSGATKKNLYKTSIVAIQLIPGIKFPKNMKFIKQEKKKAVLPIVPKPTESEDIIAGELL